MNIDRLRFRYPLNLQLFAEGEEGDDTGTGGDGANSGDGSKGEPDKRTVTMTQEELDALIIREKTRAKKPYADYDDVKAKLAALEQAEADRKKAEMSEAGRLAAELEEARKKAQEAEEAKNTALSSANQRLINAEFKTLAREANIPAERLEAALKLAELSEVTVDDYGNVIGAKEAVEALVAAHGYLVEKAQPKPIGSPSGGNGDPQDKTKDQLLKEAAEKARKTGRIEDRMAYAALKEELNK